MGVFSDGERNLAEAVSRLTYCNPFLGERTACEREILGEAFRPAGPVWHLLADEELSNRNLAPIGARVLKLVEAVRERLTSGRRTCTAAEAELYHDAVLYHIYNQYQQPLQDLLLRMAQTPDRAVPWAAPYRRFAAELARFLGIPGIEQATTYTPQHVLAVCFQLRRAFYQIFNNIIGGAMPIARLRAAIWDSIFTHDRRRYQRALYGRLGEVSTLITGPTGTGKELVATAMAHSRYIPFDPDRGVFEENFSASFHPLNPSALSPTLVESELFGHRKGAFTGALADHRGFLESCSDLGTVFLDEIGELSAGLQVKLLRVLQTRTFHRLGDVELCPFTLCPRRQST